MHRIVTRTCIQYIDISSVISQLILSHAGRTAVLCDIYHITLYIIIRYPAEYKTVIRIPGKFISLYILQQLLLLCRRRLLILLYCAALLIELSEFILIELSVIILKQLRDIAVLSVLPAIAVGKPACFTA